MTVVVYFIAKEVFNRKIGILAAMLTALNQPLIMLSVVLTTEALYIPLLVFSIYCLFKFANSAATRAKKYYLFAGELLWGWLL